MARVAKGVRYVRPPTVPDAFWNLICECWRQEPDDRPSFEEITWKMRTCDDFTLSGTELSEYQEYRTRLMRESANVQRIDPFPILVQLRRFGIDIDSMGGLHPWSMACPR
jgi:hypothetical protein